MQQGNWVYVSSLQRHTSLKSESQFHERNTPRLSDDDVGVVTRKVIGSYEVPHSVVLVVPVVPY